jgi:hypothetical protein
MRFVIRLLITAAIASVYFLKVGFNSKVERWGVIIGAIILSHIIMNIYDKRKQQNNEE